MILPDVATKSHAELQAMVEAKLEKLDRSGRKNCAEKSDGWFWIFVQSPHRCFLVPRATCAIGSRSRTSQPLLGSQLGAGPLSSLDGHVPTLGTLCLHRSGTL